MDWPHGFMRRAIPASELHQYENKDEWKRSQQPWRSNGPVQYEGMKVEMRVCYGAIVCPKCGHVTRPKTKDAPSDQLKFKCRNPRCDATEHIHQQCTARTYHYSKTDPSTGELWYFWDHVGEHAHVRPPPGRSLSLAARTALDTQVASHRDLSTFQLRTGVARPDSIPLSQISSTLADPRSARYHVEQSRIRQGLRPQTNAAGGGLAFLKGTADLVNSFGENIFAGSSLGTPTYFSIQTSFMRRMLEESVEDWIAEDLAGSGGRSRCHSTWWRNRWRSYLFSCR